MPNATVVATNTETGVQSRTITTGTGNYTLPSVPVGVYDLSVEVPGFKKFVRQGIRVAVAETARIDIRLEVGAASESVTVTADAALLKTESAEQGTNITGVRINALPINSALGASRSQNSEDQRKR